MTEKLFRAQLDSKSNMVYIRIDMDFGNEYGWGDKPVATTQIRAEIPADMFDKAKFGLMVEDRIKELAKEFEKVSIDYQRAIEAGEIEE